MTQAPSTDSHVVKIGNQDKRLALRLTIMGGTVSSSTRPRTTSSGACCRYTPLMLSTIAFCRLSMADVLMDTDRMATTTVMVMCLRASRSRL